MGPGLYAVPPALWTAVFALGCGDGDADAGGTCVAGTVLDAEGLCVPEACGLGPWPEGLGGTVAHVAVGGDDAASGAADAPKATIGAAVAQLASEGGGTVALGAGSWEEHVILDGTNLGVDLVGRCGELSSIVGVVGDPVLTVLDGERAITGLRIVAKQQGLSVRAEGGRSPRLQAWRLVIDGDDGTALRVFGTGAEVEARDLLIEGVEADDGEGQAGLYVSGGGQLDAVGGAIREIDGNAALVTGGGFLSLTDFVIEGVTAESVVWGPAAMLVNGAALTLNEVSLRDSRARAGVEVRGAGDLVASGLRIVGLSRPDESAAAIAVYVADRSTASLDMLVASDIEGVGVLISDPLSTASLGSPLLERIGLGRDAGGYGVEVLAGAVVSMSGGSVTDAVQAGILSMGAETELWASGVSISQGVGLEGVTGDVRAGAVALDGGSLTISDSTVGPFFGQGLLVAGEGASLNAASVDVYDVTVPPDSGGGVGVFAGNGGRAVVTDSSFRRVGGAGALASNGGHLDLDRVEISHIAPDDGGAGPGLRVEPGGSIVARSVLISEATRIGASVRGPLAELQVTDGSIGVPDTGDRTAHCVATQLGGSATLSGTTVTGCGGPILVAIGSGTHAEWHSSVLTPEADASRLTLGAQAVAGASVRLRDLRLGGLLEFAALSSGVGSHIDIEGTTVDAVLRTPWSSAGLGFVAQDGGSIHVTDTNISATEGPALLTGTGGSIVGEGIAIDSASFAAVAALGGTVDLSDFSIDGTTEDLVHGGGMAVLADGRYGWNGLVLQNGTVEAENHTGFYLWGEGDLQLRDLDLVGTGRAPWLPGGVIATGGIQPWDGQEGLLISGVHFDEGPVPAVLLDGSGARFGLDGGTATNSLPGAEPVRRQRCDDAPESIITDLSFTLPACASAVIPTQPVPEIWMRVGEADAAR